ncbi:MAG TPA: aspartate-semialdehyde dehydrogenase [Thermodesulfobacteriota bacterium]|nr:aspartate-semialdehyde dehydrogenase [Thermodesulfobacteriota bacterium]
MARGYRVAVAGATGAVGRVLLGILEERNFPVRELRLFASERSAGTRLSFRGEGIGVEPLGERAFDGVELAFFSCGAEQSRRFAPIAVRAGAVVIDNSPAFRMDPRVPLVVPEINGETLARHEGVVAVPNCTTIVMLMALKPLYDLSRVVRVVATSFQAASGAGARAMAELEGQLRAWAAGEPLRVEVFPHQLAFNVLPHIGRFLPNGYTTEEIKLADETRKILGDPRIRVTATTVRVPVLRAHSVAVNAETERKVSAAEARAAFARFPGLAVIDDPEANAYPMPLHLAGKDECAVGRIREDESHERALNFFVVGDQLRKGAALDAVQIAEALVARGL